MHTHALSLSLSAAAFASGKPWLSCASFVRYAFLFTKKTLPSGALVDLAFIPAFVLVARRPDLDGPLGFLGTDQFALGLVSLLGLATGYLTCSAMMLGPGCVAPRDKVLAGQMMTVCLMLGLFAGSMLGLALSMAYSPATT